MAYNSIYYVQTTKQTIPASASVTGTIETIAKKVIGTGTLFTTQFQIFDWLYVAAKSEFRQIVNIISNTEMTLDAAFTTDVAATGTPLLVKRFQATKIEVNNVGGSTVTVDGQNVIATQKVLFEKQPYGSSRANTDFVDPILLDATGSSVAVTIQK